MHQKAHDAGLKHIVLVVVVVVVVVVFHNIVLHSLKATFLDLSGV